MKKKEVSRFEQKETAKTIACTFMRMRWRAATKHSLMWNLYEIIWSFFTFKAQLVNHKYNINLNVVSVLNTKYFDVEFST